MTDPGCSAHSAAVDESMAGTSPYALAWVALEQNGPWGARAFTESHLDPDVGRTLENTAARFDVRPCLIRCPGRHADPHVPEALRRVLVAYTYPGGSWLLEGTVQDPGELLDLDFAALRAGDEEAVRRTLPTLRRSHRPHLLVCTNGRRDLCCAVEGRPVALGAAARFPDQVWEVTHTSGHRFAPTAALLPAGTLHGRLDVDAAAGLLRAAARGATVLAGSRGRSTWPIEAQAAELAVREQEEILELDALQVTVEQDLTAHRWWATVTHVDGRTWQLEVRSEESGAARAESCGRDPVAVRRWCVAEVASAG